MSSLDSFFATLQLPTMNEVGQALIRTLNDEDAGVEQVATILSKDPALSAKILRLANSAQFGLARAVSNISEAIALVGMGKVRTLALGSCMNDSFPVIAGLDRKEFWQNCTACAGYAQWLAQRSGQEASSAWLTGLMLRLGELLIAQAQPQTLAEIEKLPHLPGGRWEREQRLVGFSEGQITGELARRWNFPLPMVQALQGAHDPMESHPFSRLAGVLHLAELIAEAEQPGVEVLDTLPADIVAALKLDLQRLRETFPARESFVDVTSA
jgi:HD-like signal output (HDOD) protein